MQTLANPRFAAPRRGSLLFDLPDEMTPAEKFRRNYYLDLGLNPDNPGEALVGAEGASIANGRMFNRRLDRPMRAAGARTLWTGAQQNAALWGATGTGSAIDRPGDTQFNVTMPKFWSDAVWPVRNRADGKRGTERVPTTDFRDAANKKRIAALGQQANIEGAAREKMLMARAREALQAARRRGQVQFDPALDPMDPRTAKEDLRPRPQGPIASLVNPADYAMRSGGVMQRGGQTFEVSPGMGDARRGALQKPIFRPYTQETLNALPPAGPSSVAAAARSPGPAGQFDIQEDPYADYPAAPELVDRRVNRGAPFGVPTKPKLQPRWRTLDFPDFAPSFR